MGPQGPSAEVVGRSTLVKFSTEHGGFVFGLRGTLGTSPLTPAAQDEDVSIEFLDSRGIRRRYVFRTFSKFFHAIRDSAVQVEGESRGP